MNTADTLLAQDIKPTIVRIKVYDYLTTNRNHPTADTIYKSLREIMPTLSKTSIYNTMDLLLEKHLIQAITIEENETSFDADISDHGHFKCTRCGRVFDFHVDLDKTGHNLPADFSIQERHVYYKGYCEHCSQT